MNYKKPYEFLRSLPSSLNNFYKKKSKKNLIISNKSKNKKNYDPVTNFDKNFEKYKIKIQKKFPNDSIIGEEFNDKKHQDQYYVVY